ncbi:MarR family winged helix-turn-helix transcriptional regulator [Actinopolymorpha pittospori]|uniref:DNA-binding MarR family transcriptional regulator n=1 Tax=Actinopolymorpha pittospori TaxID=648752 RepID=A0A927N5I3_9ACTN|nr:MarR family transcriptional regulator [Actinopolymorpha pittospori]MBE1613056.1 DNA-binding MarR family transcriptional regulator [Actinopolymorpha pittospori]
MTGSNPLGSEFSRADDSTGLILWQVTNSWQAAQRAALKPFGLTHVQFVLLAALTWMEAAGPMTQSDLAAHVRTDPMMTSQVLRALETRGLLRRRPHPSDSRARAVTVTPEGADLARRANAAVEDTDRRFFSPLASGRADFTAMLRDLASAAGPAVNSSLPGE